MTTDPKTKLDELMGDYGFLEIIQDEDLDNDYGDCTDPNQVDGFWNTEDSAEGDY